MTTPNITLEDIKDAFPEPRRYADADFTGCYCVGGALAMYLEDINPIGQLEIVRFPSETSLRISVQKFNWNIPFEIAEYWVNKLIEHNDKGQFEAAWLMVNAILNYPRGE